jgi:hypothetical protein
MVEGFVGLPGSGKTYYLTKLGVEAIKKGRPVFANFKLEGAKYYNDLKQVMDIKEGLILVDEINLICPSRWWDRFPVELAYWWSQTRKNQLDVYWTSQHQDRVDKIVKEISNFIWEIRRLPFNFRFAICFLPEQIGKSKRESFGTRYFRLNKKIWNNYNTFERIEIPRNLKNANTPKYNQKHSYSQKYYPKQSAGYMNVKKTIDSQEQNIEDNKIQENLKI